MVLFATVNRGELLNH